MLVRAWMRMRCLDVQASRQRPWCRVKARVTGAGYGNGISGVQLLVTIVHASAPSMCLESFHTRGSVHVTLQKSGCKAATAEDRATDIKQVPRRHAKCRSR